MLFSIPLSSHTGFQLAFVFPHCRSYSGKLVVCDAEVNWNNCRWVEPHRKVTFCWDNEKKANDRDYFSFTNSRLLECGYLLVCTFISSMTWQLQIPSPVLWKFTHFDSISYTTSSISLYAAFEHSPNELVVRLFGACLIVIPSKFNIICVHTQCAVGMMFMLEIAITCSHHFPALLSHLFFSYIPFSYAHLVEKWFN